MLSIPHVFITLLFFYFISPARALQALGRQEIPVSDLSHASLPQQKELSTSDGPTPDRNRGSPLTRRIQVVSAGIKITRSRCPQMKLRLVFCWVDHFCEEKTALVMKEATAGAPTTSHLGRRSERTALSSFPET